MNKDIKDNRIRSVVESDRLDLTARSHELILKDVTSVLSDYFHLDSSPELLIERKGENYKITLVAVCDGLRRFNSLK